MKNFFEITQNGENFVVRAPKWAEMSNGYRPGRKWAHLTEGVLQAAELGTTDKRVFAQQSFEGELFNRRVVPVRPWQEVRWGIAAMHIGQKDVQPSPFVQTPRAIKTPYLFVELVRKGREWMIERLYHGDRYVPPLPWQTFAVDAPDGVDGCEEYWLGETPHAFTHQENLVLDYAPFESMTTTPPEWTFLHR